MGLTKVYIFVGWVIFISLVWEGGSYVTLKYLSYAQGMNYRPLVPDALTEEQAQKILQIIEGRTQYVAYDEILGWRIKPGGAFGLYQATTQGIRGEREYSIPHDIKSGRIATFGDSFTHGDEVGNPFTWQAQLEKNEPRYEVINFGVGGYGPDQSYLRYVTEGKRFRAEVVIIGLTTENVFRTVNTFRPFYSSDTGLILSKPRYALENETLSLLPNPISTLGDYKQLFDSPNVVLKKIGENDWFYQHRYRSGKFDWLPSVRLIKMVWYEMLFRQNFSDQSHGEAFHLTLEILTKFYSEVEGDSSIPIIILYPMRSDLVETMKGRQPPIALLKEALRAKKIRVIDLSKAFEKGSSETELAKYFEPYGHYSPISHGLVAQYLARQLPSYLKGH
jgi:hypothetical protein